MLRVKFKHDFYCLFHLANSKMANKSFSFISNTFVGDHTLVTSLIARLGPEIIVTHRKSVKDQYMISVMFIIKKVYQIHLSVLKTQKIHPVLTFC